MTIETQPTTIIYALCDPRTEQIRYVGKADNPIDRLQRHLRPPELNASNHKANWIRQLLSQEVKPELFIIAYVPRLNWQEHERQWIARLKEIGAPLTNSTRGGDGVDKGTKRSPESIAKTVKALTGRTVSEETRRKIIEANLRRPPPSTDSREKMSKAHKAHWASLTEEEKQKRLALLPREWTPESRAKLSQTTRGTKRGDTTSGYIGVCWFKRDEHWRSYIMVEKRQIHLGYFHDPEDAAITYNHAALEYYGEQAKYNDIPDWQTIHPEKIGNDRIGASGFKGVSYHNGKNRKRRWKATIWVDGKPVSLGYHDTPEAAYEAYCIAKNKH